MAARLTEGQVATGSVLSVGKPSAVHERSVLRQRGEAVDVHAER
jgi:hypothetical protein